MRHLYIRDQTYDTEAGGLLGLRYLEKEGAPCSGMSKEDGDALDILLYARAFTFIISCFVQVMTASGVENCSSASYAKQLWPRSRLER